MVQMPSQNTLQVTFEGSKRCMLWVNYSYLSAWSVPNKCTFPTKLKWNFIKDMQNGMKLLEQEMFDFAEGKSLIFPTACYFDSTT